MHRDKLKIYARHAQREKKGNIPLFREKRREGLTDFVKTKETDLKSRLVKLLGMLLNFVSSASSARGRASARSTTGTTVGSGDDGVGNTKRTY
jgi:hypothetical protein